MQTKILTTHIELPPGVPSDSIVGEFFELVLRKFRWFEPRRYGYASLAKTLEPARLELGALVAYYQEYGSMCVAARTDRDFIWLHPALKGAPPCSGSISWTTSASAASKGAWRVAHAQQVAEVMRLFAAPLAQVGLEEDLERKTRRWVQAGIGRTRVLTVRDYSEGLAGLVWRNFYGPPFVRMFGERLDALPPGCRQSFGEDIVLVQPYELPTAAGTEVGIARERELISLLGPECFYDHERHILPTRRPLLDALGQPLH